MTIYLAFVNDRHIEPDAEVFTTLDAAKAYLQGYLSGFDQVEVDDPPLGDGLFTASYGIEGDSVWIIPKEIR